MIANIPIKGPVKDEWDSSSVTDQVSSVRPLSWLSDLQQTSSGSPEVQFKMTVTAGNVSCPSYLGNTK